MRRFFFLTLAFLLILLFFPNITSATSIEDCEKEDISQDKVSDCIDILSQKVSDLVVQKKTLSSQITQFNSQIQITQLKIAEAEKIIAKLENEIGVLGFRINYITDSVDRLEKLLRERIVATYQQSFISNLELILTSRDFSDLILRLQYVKAVQENDKKILANLQTTKANYANQKDEREEKQAAIEENKSKLQVLKASLDTQKSEKQAFLEITKNDEVRYERLLAQAQAELAIVFGGGTETFIRDTSGGGSIGTIASHSTSPGCSTGAHLHFEIHKNGSVENPNNYLRNASYQYPSGYDQSYYGSVSPSGGDEWPLNEPVTIYQGYGSHPFAKSFYPSGIHQGIDIDSSQKTVKATRSGKLYGGSYNCSNGKLFYAKIDHGDGLTTWYLHMVPN